MDSYIMYDHVYYTLVNYVDFMSKVGVCYCVYAIDYNI